MKIFLSLLAFVLLYSCSNNISDENWDDFYKKFYADSLFQVNRLDENFIGKGFYGGEIKKITKNNWAFLRTGIYDIDTTRFKTKITFEKDKVKTRIYVNNSGIDIRSTFNKKNGKWYLTEYIDNFD
jgi:hypothetical protein